MNIRILALSRLLLFYAFLTAFGIIFVEFVEWIIEIPVMTSMVVGTMYIFNTISDKKIRNAWRQLITGRENKGSIPKNNEPNTVFEELKEEPKVTRENLKGNPLDG